ncbi:MAG: NmrA family NAD(P)-binding protein [Xenococcaceae cyanobacterium MO_207.B15]|nr:NmrA family NAD(P)-binding protein [Xenococcaceae cyanobacterium MO_207.B15]
MKPKILVMGAAGKTGKEVALQLLAKSFPVRAFVRIDDHRANKLRQAGAEIFVGNLAEMADLTKAMKGIQRAYFVAPFNPGQLYKSIAFAMAAAVAKLEVIVGITQWLSQPQHPSVATRESYMTNQILSWMPGVDLVLVNPGWFADNYMALLEPIAQLGIFPMPLGEGRTAPVSNKDIARVIVGALTNPASHIGNTYRPTGAKILNPYEIADSFARVLNRPVRYQNISDEVFFKATKSMGIELRLQSQLRYYVEEYRRGGFELGAPNNTVLEVGGHEPEDFETTIRHYVTNNPVTQPTLGNKIRALANLGKILLTPTPNLDLYEKNQSHVLLRDPKLSLDYAPWVVTHNGEISHSNEIK